jgi:hypothetical protein
MAEAQDFWTPLLGAGEKPGVPLLMRMLRKQGRPFLLLPLDPRPALATLSLYPAQTPRARLARKILGWLLRFRIGLGTSAVSISVRHEDPFITFLASLAGPARGGIPTCGILAGNPGNEGRRCILLLFDPTSRPVVVVKAGQSPRARALVRRETSFLEGLAGKISGIPRVRGTFESERTSAFALDFFKGESPRPHHARSLPQLLWRWVDVQRTVPLAEAPDWHRLEQAGTGTPQWPALAAAMRGRAVHPAIGHGDLAPWNIRISPQGNWTVLDWERGERDGIPGWDWLHYVIQVAVLVDRLPTTTLIDRVEALLDSTAFKRYAEYSGLLGFERELTLAYLLHSAKVIKPSEGSRPTIALLGALSERWKDRESSRKTGAVTDAKQDPPPL